MDKYSAEGMNAVLGALRDLNRNFALLDVKKIAWKIHHDKESGPVFLERFIRDDKVIVISVRFYSKYLRCKLYKVKGFYD